jgi:hypothetical protein
MSPDFVNPLAHEAQVTIERQLPGRMTVSATYLMTRGLRLPTSYDSNVAPTSVTRTYDVLDSSGATALATTVPWYGPAIPAAGVPAGSGRLDTGTGLILNQASVINSWYNGLVLSVRKPLSHDVELLFNYTYSKALDVPPGPAPAAPFDDLRANVPQRFFRSINA